MMKKIFSLTWILAMTTSVFAQFTYKLDSQEEGAYFEITGVEAETTLSGTVEIPETIDNDGTTFTVTSIGAEAFKGQTDVTSFVLPSTLKRIKEFAFAECKRLSSITIPASVITIGDNPFKWCENLSEILVDEENSHFKSVDGVLISISETNSTLYCYPCRKEGNEYLVPEGVTKVGSYAFVGAYRLDEVSFPDETKSIGPYAFTGCNNLYQLNFGAGIEYMQAPVFLESEEDGSGYIYLSEVHFSSQESAPSIIGVFNDMPDIKLCIPLGSRSIYENSTYEISSTQGPVSTGWNLDVIRKKTVEEGYAVENNNDTPLLYNSIWNYETDEPVEGEVQVAINMKNPYSGSIQIPEEITVNGETYAVTRIGEDAFYYNDNLYSVYLPASIKSLGGTPFRNNPNLYEIQVDTENEYFTSGDDGGLYSKDLETLLALPGGMQLEEGTYITLEDTKKIGYGAISGSQYLEKFYSNAILVESGNFVECYNLKEIHLTNEALNGFYLGSWTGYNFDLFLSTNNIPEANESDETYFYECRLVVNNELYEQIKDVSPWNLFKQIVPTVESASFDDNVLGPTNHGVYAENLSVTLNFTHEGPRSACLLFPIPVNTLRENGIEVYELHKPNYIEKVADSYILKFRKLWSGETPVEKPLIFQCSEGKTKTISIQNVLLPKDEDVHSIEIDGEIGVTFNITMVESSNPDFVTEPTDPVQLNDNGYWALGGGKFGHVSATATILPHRWYVYIPESVGSTGAAKLRLSLDDADVTLTTAIETIGEQSAPTLPIYNLNGQRVVNPSDRTHGYYIQGGKIIVGYPNNVITEKR